VLHGRCGAQRLVGSIDEFGGGVCRTRARGCAASSGGRGFRSRMADSVLIIIRGRSLGFARQATALYNSQSPCCSQKEGAGAHTIVFLTIS
jgi:hypothetical protein